MTLPIGLEELVLKVDREMKEGHMLAARGHWLDIETAKGQWLLSDARMENLRVAYERKLRGRSGQEPEGFWPISGRKKDGPP